MAAQEEEEVKRAALRAALKQISSYSDEELRDALAEDDWPMVPESARRFLRESIWDELRMRRLEGRTEE